MADASHRSEGRAATPPERVADVFHGPVLFAALLVIPVIAVEESHAGEPWSTAAAVANWGIWLVFAAETIAVLTVVPDRWAWIRQHPLEVAIVLLTPPFLPASLQSARAFRLLRLLRLVRTARVIKQVFSLQGLRYASVVAAFGILGGGAVFAAVESDQHLGTWDGVWFAITTVTTVGYGDITPKTDGGRITAIVIMVVGIAYVAMLTAAMAQLFLASLVEKESKVTMLAESEVLARIDELASHIARLEAAIRSLDRSVPPLEDAVSPPTQPD